MYHPAFTAEQRLSIHWSTTFSIMLTAAPHQVILVADDDPHVRQLLEITLQTHGYRVFSASNGHELVQLAQQHVPDLILTDLLMPEMDGYEAIRQLRRDTRTAHVPMLILTARALSHDLVTGFETGADDYIIKPFDLVELLVRVKSHLRRTARMPVHHPLSGLPGSRLLAQELQHRMGQNQSLALLHIDIDNFKTFNDTYGFARGDQLILLVADLLQNVIATEGLSTDFISHIGGDDFAVITTPEQAETICQRIIAQFDQHVRQLYPAEDWQRGYVFGTDRYGILRRFPVTAISIGVATNQTRAFHDAEEFAHVAAEVKHYAKMQPGSNYAINQRVEQANTEVERRTTRLRDILIVSENMSLRTVLKQAFRKQGYVTHDVTDLAQLQQRLEREATSILLVADAQLGQPIEELCTQCKSLDPAPPIIVLTYTSEQTAHYRQLGATACLQEPLPLAEVVTCVDHLMIYAQGWKNNAS